MEFLPDDHVIVNPLRIKRWIVDELEANTLLYYTGASRSSAAIIDEQKANTTKGNREAIEAMHRIKQSALYMKSALLTGNITRFTEILGKAWEDKKKDGRSDHHSQLMFRIAIEAGATTGKVSGAGGGGFVIFAVEPTRRVQVVRALNQLNGRIVDFQFSEGGTHGWKIYNT